jgi:hypothetical protein
LCTGDCIWRIRHFDKCPSCITRHIKTLLTSPMPPARLGVVHVVIAVQRICVKTRAKSLQTFATVIDDCYFFLYFQKNILPKRHNRFYSNYHLPSADYDSDLNRYTVYNLLNSFYLSKKKVFILIFMKTLYFLNQLIAWFAENLLRLHDGINKRDRVIFLALI